MQDHAKGEKALTTEIKTHLRAPMKKGPLGKKSMIIRAGV